MVRLEDFVPGKAPVADAERHRPAPGEDAVPERHDTWHLRTARVHRPAGSAGAETACQPDPSPWGVRTEQPVEDEVKRALVIEQLDRLRAFREHFGPTREGHFKASYQEFVTSDEFERQLDALLRGWLEEHVLQGSAVLWPVHTKGSPFRGLSAFSAKHAPVFFGRDADTTRATDAFKDAADRGTAFLLLVGASGSGKSSLARAGITPPPTRPGVVSAIDNWRVATMRPSEVKGEPAVALAQRLFIGRAELGLDEEGRPEALPEPVRSPHRVPGQLASVLGHRTYPGIQRFGTGLPRAPGAVARCALKACDTRSSKRGKRSYSMSRTVPIGVTLDAARGHSHGAVGASAARLQPLARLDVVIRP